MIAALCARVAQADQKFVAQGDPGSWREDTTIVRMDSGTAARLAALIRAQRSAALGTLREGAPLVSMVTYLPAQDLATIYLHVSALAWHTQDMRADPGVSLLIAETDQGAGDPQALARVSLRGEAQPMASGTPEHVALKAAWLQRYPDAAVTFELPDFAFYRVAVREARFVAGFGRIHTLSGSALSMAAISPLSGSGRGLQRKTGHIPAAFPVHGVDFTSAPGRRKAITVASGELAAGAFELRDIEGLHGWPQFEAWLARPGPWVAGFDFPFGLPREAVLDLGWPQRWDSLVRHCASLGREALRETLDAYRESRVAGDKYPHRRGDRAAFSHSPVKLVNPPVALMFLEGAPRLLAAGLEIPGLQRGDAKRIALEAYPGFAVRQLSEGKRPPSYKNDARIKQTPEHRRVRRDLVRRLVGGEGPLGIGLAASEQMLESLVEDASGDRLDAVLCALQAAWAWQRREANYGLPPAVDPLEGWIVGVPSP